MPKWKTEIEEVSNGVYRLTMTHELGAVIEKVSSDLEQLKIHALEEATMIQKRIDEKLGK